MAGEALSALVREYPAGTVLFEENDPGSRMYVIRVGRVRIFRRTGGAEIVLALLGPGDFFGEMALLENLPRSAAAQAMEYCKLIEVDAATFEQMIRGNVEIAVRIMRRLAARLRQSDERIEALLGEGALGRVVDVLRWLLPQGRPEGTWVRLKGAVGNVDLVTQAGIPSSQGKQVMQKLESAGCVKIDAQDLLIARREHLDEYASFLELKLKYDASGAELPLEVEDLGLHERYGAMRRLLEALELSPRDLAERQQALTNHYRRYVELKQRFKAFEGNH